MDMIHYSDDFLNGVPDLPLSVIGQSLPELIELQIINHAYATS